MYGSLVLFGAGMGLMFRNVAVACLMAGVFIPLMIRRARCEEVHLGAACDESLDEFRRAVPMILPHFPEFLARPADARSASPLCDCPRLFRFWVRYAGSIVLGSTRRSWAAGRVFAACAFPYR